MYANLEFLLKYFHLPTILFAYTFSGNVLLGSVQYPLEILEKLVSDLIERIRIPAGLLPEAGDVDAGVMLRHETGHIQQSLIRDVFQLSQAKEIERLIQSYQSALTHFLDRLYEAQSKTVDLSASVQKRLDESYISILDLLSFIEERFSKCFDKNEKVPDVYFILTVREMEESWDKMEHEDKWTDADRRMLERIKKDFRRFMQSGPHRMVSYEEVIYRKALVRELDEMEASPAVENESSAAYFTPLEQALVYMNYNDKEFVQFMLSRIGDQLDRTEDLRDEMAMILEFSKLLHQQPVKPEAAFLPRHPSLQAQLSQWLSEELYFLERRLNMFAISGTHTTVSEKKAILECRVSVDQLGIFFRAATDTKIIFTASQKKLFEQIAPYLSTPNRLVLSPDSMRSKSYSPERKDIEGVKNLLMEMYRKVSSY